MGILGLGEAGGDALDVGQVKLHKCRLELFVLFWAKKEIIIMLRKLTDLETSDNNDYATPRVESMILSHQ